MTYSALCGPLRLPARVPIHFDGAGRPNGWGSPMGMIAIPVIACVLYGLMSIVSRFPDAFHYPVRVTASNRARLQSIALDMIAWLKAELACLFAVLQWTFIHAAQSGDGRLFPMVMPGFIVAIFATIGWHFVAIFTAARAAK
jgi:uncharacterized membrane protein